ncbi:HhH-GPD family protein [Tessaracoccus antarcticus]|uniref:A/G-specific adenine glycosylase n=1 Tax=Tessaracoccus antarcticus TaxID=2479848 RepID=UPI00389B134E
MHDETPIAEVTSTVSAWFARSSRDLPWRSPQTTAWGVLVSEIMLQQTPASRVVTPWQAWMARWPSPADLAAAGTDDVLRAWDRLGYPRRALRLQQAARAIVDHHGGDVPDNEDALRALPGIGSYTAAAVRAFAFGRRSLVLDVNIRRVLARLDGGVEHPARSETAQERRRAWQWVPDGDRDAATWSAAAMELGATVCTARSPRCPACPVATHCTWLALGRPAWDGPERVAQPWDGTDRQCRGRIMAALRASTATVALADIVWADDDQRRRCAASLVDDGLAEPAATGLRLPGSA